MSRPSLLLVANFDSNVGYAWWLMESFWAALANQYHTEYAIHLCYPSISVIPHAIQNAPITVDHLDFASTRVRDIWKQTSYIRQHRTQIIYLSDAAQLHWRYALFRFLGLKTIIVHDHSPGQRPYSKGLKRLLKKLTHSLRFFSATAYFGTSDFVRLRLIQSGCIDPDKCFSIPNGIPLTPTKEAERSLHNLSSIPSSAVLIAMVSRANFFKGIPFALRCMQKLLENGNNVHFIFCGDGPHLEEFRKIAVDLSIQNHVTFAGKQSNIDSILGSCDIAFHPSQGEVGYSLSILEYMKNHLPVVVPNNPSVCGATRHNIDGIVYNNDDIDSAVAALASLVQSSDLRRQLGAEAGKIVVDKYSLKTTHAALISAMDKTLSQSHLAEKVS